MKNKERIEKLEEEVASLKCRLVDIEGVNKPIYWECVNDDGYGYTEGEIYEEIPKEGNLISLKDDAGRLISWTVKGEDIIHYGRTCFRKVTDKETEPKEQPIYWECVNVYKYNFTKGKKYKEIRKRKEGCFMYLRDDKGDLGMWGVYNENVTDNGKVLFRKVTDKETEPQEQPVYWKCVRGDVYCYTRGKKYKEIPKEGNLISLKSDTGDLVIWEVEYENVIYNGRTCFRKVIDTEPSEKLILEGYLTSEFRSDTRNELKDLFKQFLIDKKLKFNGDI